MSILDEIFEHKRAEVAGRKKVKPLAEVQAAVRHAPPPLDFLAALAAAPPVSDGDGRRAAPALIAEVKRGSPSRGLLARDFDPLRLARVYAGNGAAAISVLTDERYFGGRLDDLVGIAQLGLRRGSGARLPLLRKDFLCDPYQVYEARAAGADAILLIVAALPPALLQELHALALELGMAPLVEVHRAEELELALICRPLLVGINNRDLRDFSVSLDTTLRLRPGIPPGTAVVAESGIHTRQDIDRLAEAGVDAVLVGEALVVAEDVAAKVRELSGQGKT